MGWTKKLRRMITPLARRQPGGVELVQRMVEAGRWGVFEVTAPSVDGSAHLVWSIAGDADGSKRFNINYSGGDPGCTELIPETFDALEAFATACGCRRLHFMTDRLGLARRAERAGFQKRQVLIKELPDV